MNRAIAATAQGNSGSARRSASGLRTAVFYWSRQLHYLASILVCGLIVFFAFSGFLANHPDWFASAPRLPAQKDLALPTAATGRADIIASLASRHGGELNDKSVEEEDGQLVFETESVWATRTFTVDTQRSVYALDEHPVSWPEAISNLHRGKHAGLAQKFVMDAAAISLLFVTMTGIVLGLQIKNKRRIAVTLILVSSVSLIFLLVQR